jgi:hypothetical protein
LYSKEQASQIKQAFWTSFGQYMALETSAEGLRINWINYKTGVKHLYFKMQADQKNAKISIEMTNPDAGMQALLFEQFGAFKKILEAELNEIWDWELHGTDEYGKTISKIYTVLPGVNIFRKEDWPAMISFLKPRIIALDAFWTDAQHGFEAFK